MEKYIALLRGVNISGKNKVSMPILKAAFEDIGFVDVATYINSCNVLFSSSLLDVKELNKLCEDRIKNTFQLDIPVTVVPLTEVKETLKYAPSWWDDANKEIIHYAIFLIPPIRVEEVFAAVGEIKPEYEKIDYYGNIIFWSATLKTFNKSKYSKIASSSINYKVTLRTSNTVKKLIQMAE